MLIPDGQLSEKQKDLRVRKLSGYSLPLYALRREPTNLEDIDWDEFGGNSMSIWRNNHTIICVTLFVNMLEYKNHSVCFDIHRGIDEKHLLCVIFGESHDAVAETATFFWSLKQKGSKTGLLRIRKQHDFDFSTLHTERLSLILDSNPARAFEFLIGTWNAEQAEVFATRPYRLTLRLSGEFTFQDEGTSFVNALQRRHTSFGWLNIPNDDELKPFSRANLLRLLRLDDAFEKLTIGWLVEDDVLLPFSMKVKALAYEFADEDIQLEKFESLDIETKDLTIKMHIIRHNDEDWTQRPIAFLDRAAELGHFEKFGFAADTRCVYIDPVGVEPLAEAFIRVIQGNPNLTRLTLGDDGGYLEWEHQLEKIFKAMEDHPNLRTFTMRKRAGTYFDFSSLEKLLSRNRDIIVLDESGKIILNGGSIDRLYALNRRIKGSAKLVNEKIVSRPLLATAALLNCALGEFQYIYIVLSDHTDILCEYISDADLELVE